MEIHIKEIIHAFFKYTRLKKYMYFVKTQERKSTSILKYTRKKLNRFI